MNLTWIGHGLTAIGVLLVIAADRILPGTMIFTGGAVLVLRTDALELPR